MKCEFLVRAQEIIKKTKWNEITQKAVSEKYQDLVESTESYRTMSWFEIDESVEFGKNIVAKRKAIDSESDSESEEVDFNIVQGSELSTFVSSKIKARSSNTAEGNDDISAFMQMTQNTYENRIVKMEAQLDDF